MVLWFPSLHSFQLSNLSFQEAAFIHSENCYSPPPNSKVGREGSWMILGAGELSLGVHAHSSLCNRFCNQGRLDTFLRYWKYSALSALCSPGAFSPFEHIYMSWLVKWVFTFRSFGIWFLHTICVCTDAVRSWDSFHLWYIWGEKQRSRANGGETVWLVVQEV